jgi:hypothetical protein
MKGEAMKGILKCPFCGKKPSGKYFYSSDRGPGIQCQNCRADGPPALEKDDMVGGLTQERRLYKKAIKRWNTRVPG